MSDHASKKFKLSVARNFLETQKLKKKLSEKLNKIRNELKVTFADTYYKNKSFGLKLLPKYSLKYTGLGNG